ncbi:MAG: purine-binding chemotaxis protein CheW [Nitrospira sp.]|nr:purine-binding chemotaxis protein CheW [Nitrospira sp.]
MDIARIRKKQKEIKETDSKQLKVSSQKAEDLQGTGIKPDETLSEAEVTHETETVKSIPLEKKKEVQIEKPKTKETGGKSHEEKTDTIIEILTFSLLNEEFAFRVSQVEEILRSQRITRVPKLPSYVLGITSLRGKIIPVIDLKQRLSLKGEPTDMNSKGKILIIKGPQGPIGAAIDKVISVVRFSESEIIPPPSHLTESELKFIEGVVILDKRFISIIHMEEAIKIVLNSDK